MALIHHRVVLVPVTERPYVKLCPTTSGLAPGQVSRAEHLDDAAVQNAHLYASSVPRLSPWASGLARPPWVTIEPCLSAHTLQVSVLGATYL